MDYSARVVTANVKNLKFKNIINLDFKKPLNF